MVDDRKTTRGAHDLGEWVERTAVMLPGRLLGASEMEKKAAVESGGLGEMRLRYRVITPEQLAAETAAREAAELDAQDVIEELLGDVDDEDNNDGNG